MRIRSCLQGVKLVRMSDGSYCIVRNLGKLKGGLGIRCHETLLRLTPEGIVSKLTDIFRHVAGHGVQDMPMAGVPGPYDH